MNFVTGAVVKSGILPGPDADNGGYKVQPPVKKLANILIKYVNAIISIKPVIISIQFGKLRLNEF